MIRKVLGLNTRKRIHGRIVYLRTFPSRLIYQNQLLTQPKEHFHTSEKTCHPQEFDLVGVFFSQPILSKNMRPYATVKLDHHFPKIGMDKKSIDQTTT